MSDEMVQVVTWQPGFATGVAIIDDQHRVLINMLNDAAVKLTDQSTPAEIGRLVQGLISYADYHFKTEERLISEQGYASDRPLDADAHLEQHRRFVEQVVAVRDRLEQGERITRQELVSFLSAWLSNHILHTDKTLGAFILDRKIGKGGV